MDRCELAPELIKAPFEVSFIEANFRQSSADRCILMHDPRAGDARAAFLHVLKLEVHHGCHQGIVERVMLVKGWNLQIRQNGGKAKVEHRSWGSAAVL